MLPPLSWCHLTAGKGRCLVLCSDTQWFCPPKLILYDSVCYSSLLLFSVLWQTCSWLNHLYLLWLCLFHLVSFDQLIFLWSEQVNENISVNRCSSTQSCLHQNTAAAQHVEETQAASAQRVLPGWLWRNCGKYEAIFDAILLGYIFYHIWKSFYFASKHFCYKL